MFLKTPTAGALALALALSSQPALGAPHALADQAGPGFALGSISMPTGVAAYGTVTCTLPGGDVITFDGEHLERWTAAGGFVQSLGAIAAPGYAAFILPLPDGSGVAFAHSGDFFAGVPGELFRAPLSGSGPQHVAQITFAYDAVFLDDGDLLVSADTSGSAQTNDLLRVDLTSGQVTPLGQVGGPSGPVALRSGDLFYAPAEIAFPAQPGTGELVFWTAAQLAAATSSPQTAPLTDANATVWASGYDPIGSIAVDPVKDRIYVAENVYDAFGGTVSSVIRWARKNVASAELVVDPELAATNLELVNVAGGAANFQAYQPGDGYVLKYNTTDFFSSADHSTVTPLRPVITASGPGLVGLGAVTLTATGAPADGTLYLVFGPQVTMSPTEQTYNHPGYLFHTYLSPAGLRRLPFLIPTDSSGTGSFTLYNDGSLTGMYGYQYLVGDGTANFVGATGVVTF